MVLMLCSIRRCRLGQLKLKSRCAKEAASLRRRMSTNDIRRNFIRFFENYDHVHVPSSSLLPPEEDRSLLFTNAGMNQFKPVFLGSMDCRWSFLERAVSYQKCLRAGGKHNDLENVGRDLHHQTFFEMLGNWSFNDSYSKEDACKLAWHFLTDVLSIDPARLYVTYFGGSKEWNLPQDENCRRMWLKLGLKESHVLPFVSENFWEMGLTGPCGPCTEIHYDRVPGRSDASHLVNVDDSVVELWNIVFISLMRTSTGSLEPLPSHHIDTGMGLERLASVMQNVSSNFDTDIFTPIMKQISKVSKVGDYGGLVGPADADGRDASFRILADHMRATVVALADGVQPSAVDAGFIVRKMLRRSFWHAVSRLGIDRYACCELVPVVIDTLKPAYPELGNYEESVTKIVAEEERQYWNVVDRGSSLFEQMRATLPAERKTLPGEIAWVLHDTHGIPIEITEDLSRKHGLSVDEKRFQELKEEAKELSRSRSKLAVVDSIDTTGLEGHTDIAKYEYFLVEDGSYVFPTVKSKILATFNKDERVSSISSSGSIVLENCQFYAEEGGQKSDRGLLELNQEPIFEVTSVEKMNGIAVLHGNVIGQARISEGLFVEQKIDVERRKALMRAHTATHLLNWALRRVGAGAGQRGSSIEEDHLRFDYATDDCAGEDDVIENVETLIRNVISEGKNVVVEETPLREAEQMRQLQSEFKESKKYPDIVRMARVGDKLEDAIAVECCSGTHVLNTSSILEFTVLSDRSSAKGVRRILALTGEKARESRRYGEQVLRRLEHEDECLDEGSRTDAPSEKIDWGRMPYQDNIRCRELLKSMKEKRKAKKDTVVT